MLHQWVYQLFDMVLFGVVVIFLEIPFCVVKFGIKTYVTIFIFVAGVNREFIWELLFCLFKIFFLLTGRFCCVFYLCLKILSVCVPGANFRTCG